MQTLDVTFVLALNGLARKSWSFDAFVVILTQTSLLKGGVLVALLWWTWERTGAKRSALPIGLTVAGVLAAIATTRVSQNFLPARPRPLHEPALVAAGFVPPYEVPPDVLRDWSSFPSDSAGSAFAIATAVFLAHRGAGTFAYIWALLVISLPRVYLGYHYPTDVLGGAAIGTAVMVAVARLPVPTRIENAAERWAEAYRGWFYAGLFLLSYQLATNAEDTRGLAGFAVQVLSAAWHRN